MELASAAARRQSGIALVVVSAIVFSTAGLFTKGVAAGAWAVIFWRGIAAAAFTFAWIGLRGDMAAEARAFRGPAVWVAVAGAAGTAAFIPAFKLTTIANVALIYAAAPFAAAALAWIFLREAPGWRVTLASLAAFAGVAVIFGGQVSAIGRTGDLLALWMTVMLATIMVIYRRWPETPAAFPMAVSSVLLLPPALAFGDPLAVALAELPVLALFGLVFAVASVTLSEGARRLAPAETALLSALETPLAPVLAWLVLTEAPAAATILGGGIVLGAVVASQIARR